jgi:UPF0042 nucleotide-binding protein
VKKLILSSFGFKYGLPPDANYVFDARFIPNPYYVAELRPLSGMDDQVRKYIRSFEATDSFLDAVTLFLDFAIPRYLDGERKVLHAAVGCTGGRHRSVALVEWLCAHYKSAAAGFEVELRHRDIDRAREA